MPLDPLKFSKLREAELLPEREKTLPGRRPDTSYLCGCPTFAHSMSALLVLLPTVGLSRTLRLSAFDNSSIIPRATRKLSVGEYAFATRASRPFASTSSEVSQIVMMYTFETLGTE